MQLINFIKRIFKKFTSSFVFLGYFKKVFAFKKLNSRGVRLFISNRIILNLLRLTVALIFAFVVFCSYVYFYKPEYIQRLKNHSLILLSKYSNIDFKGYQIIINGVNKSDRDVIIKIISDRYSNKNVVQSINNFDDLAKEIKSNQKWIDSIHIFRSLPNKINVDIVEYVPFALWKKADKYYVVDSNGKIIPIDDSSQYEDLIILSGKDAYIHVKSLFNIMAISPEISSRIYSATWVGNRRWDLRFDNSLLIKMPSTQITNSWNKLIDLHNADGSFYNLKVIDLRIKDKIYLEYKD